MDEIIVNATNLKKYSPMKGGIFSTTKENIKAVDNVDIEIRQRGNIRNGVLFGLFHTNPLGRVLIWIAALITLWSMIVYLKAALRPPPGVRPLDE